MLNLPSSLRIFWAVQPCDMRKQFDGLAALVLQDMQRDPQNGDLFVFQNRRRDFIKILFYDTHGFCLLAKRLEKGTFQVRLDTSAKTAEITSTQLACLLGNLRLEGQIGAVAA